MMINQQILDFLKIKSTQAIAEGTLPPKLYITYNNDNVEIIDIDRNFDAIEYFNSRYKEELLKSREDKLKNI